jgi:transposase
MRRKRPEGWRNKTWMLHHKNAPPHTSLLIGEFFAKQETTLIPQPPYSPDLAPVDFFLFPKLKSTLKSHQFQMIEEISLWDLCAVQQNTFQNWKKLFGAVYKQWRGVL